MLTFAFDEKTRRRFLDGFIRGIGAPAMMHDYREFPEAPTIISVSAPEVPVYQSIEGDWQKIGGDLRCVVVKHGKTIRPARKKRHHGRR